MKRFIRILVLFAGCILCSSCSGNYTKSIYNDTLNITVMPTDIISPSPTESIYQTQQNYIATPNPLPEPDTKSISTPIVTQKPAFSDNGKVPGWKQSSEFPTFAYNKSTTPKELYRYKINQQTVKSRHVLTVLPVDFYNETTQQTRDLLLKYYKEAITTYYSQNSGNVSEWISNMHGYLDPKSPIIKINEKLPNDFIVSVSNKITSGNLNMSVESIYTDDSLIYLDANSYYRVRGRIVINIVSSTDPSLLVGKHTYDTEIAFKKILISGPDNWATKNYTLALIIKLN